MFVIIVVMFLSPFPPIYVIDLSLIISLIYDTIKNFYRFGLCVLKLNNQYYFVRLYADELTM